MQADAERVLPKEGSRLERADEAANRMSDDNKTLWGIPIVVTNAMPRRAVLLGRLPTYEEVQQHGSVENAIQHMKDQWWKLKIGDETPGAEEIG